MEIFENIAMMILGVMLVIGAILAVLALIKSKEDKSGEPNYRVFYKTGLILLPIGTIWIGASFILDISFVVGIPFLGVAVTYLIIGLANRDKWRK